MTRFGESRRLTPTLAGVLERPLSEGDGTAVATQRRRTGMSAESLAVLEKTLGDGMAAVRREGERAREEQARALVEPERWLAALESAAPGGNSSAEGGAAADGTRSGSEGRFRGRAAPAGLPRPGDGGCGTQRGAGVRRAATAVIVQSRNEALDEVIVDRRMLRLRRCLTFGLWRNWPVWDAVGTVVPLLPECSHLAANTLPNLALTFGFAPFPRPRYGGY